MATEMGRVRQNSYENYSEGQDRLARLNRRGELVVVDFYLQCALDGRVFAVQVGSEDAGAAINSTAAPADTVVFALTDAALGTTIIPVEAQVAVQTWTTSSLVAFMLEADMGIVRFSAVGGGGAFIPVNLRGDSPRLAASTSYVNLTTGAGVTAAAKSTIGGADGSFEFHQYSIEDNWGDTGDTIPENGFHWRAKDSGAPPIIVGPGSFLLHFAATTADMTGYANYRFIELPTESIT